jgi:hypothetical protein
MRALLFFQVEVEGRKRQEFLVLKKFASSVLIFEKLTNYMSNIVRV